SGIGGVGLGPLAEIAHDAGFYVCGSDLHESPLTEQLVARGVAVSIGQDGSAIAAQHATQPIDWFVYTAALPDDHPELAFAREHSLRISKRDELLAEIIRLKQLKLVAVSGTHGKTTTTGMLVWAFRELGLPVSYSVGSTLSFAPSGQYDEQSEYFVYECDEYDRNMLHFEPYLSIIPSLDYDHPDTYKNEHVYKKAFLQFIEQSGYTLLWEKNRRFLDVPDIAADYETYDEHMNLSTFSLTGDHVRKNAFLVMRALTRLFPDDDPSRFIDALNRFPGTGRRFEKLADNLYSDYGHHPAEIAATLQLARELSDTVVLVYQPHQNIRQHHLRHEYTNCMALANEIYWLPTYLTREDPALPVLTPNELSRELPNASSVHVADANNDLWQVIEAARAAGKLVLVMGAGTIDGWVRERLRSTTP
ncbi:MAG TPA: Mur ligase domain-containing protein, partial [Candidatus Saccharibacteria bacterium]|nr:Mur ligase domain-containing protein [Candidatus Saccharibacteria bacterium]